MLELLQLSVAAYASSESYRNLCGTPHSREHFLDALARPPGADEPPGRATRAIRHDPQSHVAVT